MATFPDFCQKEGMAAIDGQNPGAAGLRFQIFGDNQGADGGWSATQVDKKPFETGGPDPGASHFTAAPYPPAALAANNEFGPPLTTVDPVLYLHPPMLDYSGLMARMTDLSGHPETEYLDHNRRQVRTAYLQGLSAKPQSLLELAGIKTDTPFCYISFNENIGDTLIDGMGFIHPLLKRSGEVVFASPVARVLRTVGGLKPVSFETSLARVVNADMHDPATLQILVEELEKIKKSIISALPQGALVWLDLESILSVKSRLLIAATRQGCGGIARAKSDKKIHPGDYAFMLENWVREWRRQIMLNHPFVIHEMKSEINQYSFGRPGVAIDSLRFFPGFESGAKFSAGLTVYENRAIFARMFFGENFSLSWPQNLFHEESGEISEKFLAWQRAAFDYTTKPLLVVNANTRNDGKLCGAKNEWLGFLDFVIAQYVEDANIALTYPDVRMGNEIHQGVFARVAAHRGSVAVLPESNHALVNQAVISADAVLTQDSGFTHLAYVLRGGHQGVMTISFDDANLAREWRWPGSAYALINNSEDSAPGNKARFYHEISRFIRHSINP